MPPSAVQSTAASSLRSTPSLSASLWSDPAVQRVVSACESNGFVRALEAGSLPLQAFQGFLSQDKFFLGAFSRAYALARDKSSAAGDAASAAEFGDLLAGVENELSLHAGYAARWGVDMSLVRPAPACSEYTSFLLAVAEKEGVAACAAAMVPCMRLYAELGRRIAARQAACRAAASSPQGGAAEGRSCGAGAYQEWVDTYAAAEIDSLATELEALLDRVAARGSAPPREVLRERYLRAMQLELGFFDAWSPSRGRATASAGPSTTRPP